VHPSSGVVRSKSASGPVLLEPFDGLDHAAAVDPVDTTEAVDLNDTPRPVPAPVPRGSSKSGPAEAADETDRTDTTPSDPPRSGPDCFGYLSAEGWLAWVISAT
jgi:hypothetical protein